MAEEKLEALLVKAEALLDRLANYLPSTPEVTDWTHLAYRFQAKPKPGTLLGIDTPHQCRLDDLLGLERQKQRLLTNTQQFVAGLTANNALLWGARGTGKSTLIKSLLSEFQQQNLRLIEVDKDDLVALPQILTLIRCRPEKFILYCDDLSFEANDASYKALKVVLDGSLQAPADNCLIYASSNRRHLMPEFLKENLQSEIMEGEIHPGENVDEKLSLTERFGLWLAFHPFNQETYLKIVRHWIKHLSHADTETQELEAEALRWALSRGSRSGRVARQFAQDWVGRQGLEKNRQLNQN